MLCAPALYPSPPPISPTHMPPPQTLSTSAHQQHTCAPQIRTASSCPRTSLARLQQDTKGLESSQVGTGSGLGSRVYPGRWDTHAPHKISHTRHWRDKDRGAETQTQGRERSRHGGRRDTVEAQMGGQDRNTGETQVEKDRHTIHSCNPCAPTHLGIFAHIAPTTAPVTGPPVPRPPTRLWPLLCASAASALEPLHA